MKICFLLSHAPNPRLNKRIDEAKKHNKVTVVYWNKISVNIWDEFHKDIEYFRINVKAHYTNPFKRILPYLKFKNKALKSLKNINPDLIYTSNIDMLIIAKKFKVIRKSTKIIYEIADINRLISDKQKHIFKKIARFLLIKLETKLSKYITHLVLTSAKFYDFYYSKFIDKQKVIILNNIPNPLYFSKYIRSSGEEFTVGFIGALRYYNQLKMLLDASKISSTHVMIAGQAMDECYVKLLDEYEVDYCGKYNYETDIAFLYSKISCVYAVYDNTLNNVKIALPNKLFEAIYCGLPIIVSKDTYLSEIVEKYQIGISINPNSVSELVDALVTLKNDKNMQSRISNNCKIALRDFDYEKELEIQKLLFKND